MELLQDLLTSGRIVDLMLGFVVFEIVALSLLRRRFGGGISTLPLLVNIGAGASLMLALRAELTGSGWRWVAAWLVAALVCHVWDLWLRWRSAPQDGQRPADGVRGG
jgi:hypothetical protein